MTTAVLSPNGDTLPANPLSAQKRKFSALDGDKPNGISSERISPSLSVPSNGVTSRMEVDYKDILTVLQGHDTTPSILTHSLETLNENSEDGPSAKRPRLPTSAESSTIAQNLESLSYEKLSDLVQDVKRVSLELLMPWQDQSAETNQDLSIQPANLSNDGLRLWAGIAAFNKVLRRIVDEDANLTKQAKEKSKLEHINGTSERASNTNGEIVIKNEDESNTDSFNTGQSVLTIFANTQGATKQLFSSLQQSIEVGDRLADTVQGLNDAVEITLPIKETALPNFVSVTKIPAALEGQKPVAKPVTFADKFGPPKSIPNLQPPKPSNKLVTKSSNVGWVSPEALSRHRSDKDRASGDRSYNWCSTRLSSSAWLKYNGVDLPKEPASPEERRRQRDRALSTGAAQIVQTAENKVATIKAKDDALFRAAFSSFAPTRDNSGAVVSEDVKSKLWWTKVGHQRAQRTFAESTEPLTEHNDEIIDHDEEEKLFKDAIENIDPDLLDISAENQKHEADKEIDDLLQDLNEQIETLYSYQRIRNSVLSSSSTPMTPVGQRTALTGTIGTPTTPSTAENEVYKVLKSQLALLIMQLPPAAVAKLNSSKLQKLNISADIVFDTPDDAGTLEDNAPKQPVAAPQPVTTRNNTSNSYSGHANQYTRQQAVHTPAALGPRSNSYYGSQQRTSSLSYQRPSGSVQAITGGYPSTGPRAGYNANYSQTGFGQTPSRSGYGQPGSYYQQVQHAAAKTATGYTATTPQGVPRFPQTPISYSRPASNAQYNQTGVQPAQSPQYAPTTPAAGTPQLNRTTSSTARPSYFHVQASAASGPTGFHTSMSAQEQQSLMDRHRAQIAAQNQARLQAMGAAANLPATTASSYTTPSREGSGTPRPLAPSDAKPPVQPNGIS